ncbi:MAG: hypothetical protein NZ922_02280 [Candidatus Methanomethyliaceae archaeon]|nr:hypothetical protein [Candidatus Methanomethyliaceae archaeon]MDW7971006.1 hypothetical protein [Nitrososphaerota archaeon]
MAEIQVLLVPNLRKSYEKASLIIEESHFDMLFLNLPRNTQYAISSYCSGKITLNELKERLNFLPPEPTNSWIYFFEPILKVLKHETYCYIESYDDFAKITSEILVLTFRSIVTGKINLREWIELLKPKSMDFEVEFISHRARGKCLCISDIHGWNLAHGIRKYDHKVSIKSVERLYFLKPLESLCLLIERGKLDMAEALIKEHIKFISEFVLKSNNIDEAYFSWIKKYSYFR